MKTILTAAALCVAAATTAFADPLVGTWRTIKDENGNSGHIHVKPCGANFCGVLGQSFDSAGKPFKSENTGKRIIWDMKAQGGGKYSGGKIWNPANDKTYNSRLKLSGSKLKVDGCVLGICRDAGTWMRVN
ncbi:DUF2147 domain-containing protein [Planktotalea sp.]|uniref:DUF2147 domain-containing protein n=1 Tax=Planktotalea sp. TaxID=2029877 RepID=UPI003D6B0455